MIYSVLHYQDSSRFVKHTFLKSTFVSEMPQIHTVLITYRIYSYCGDFILMRSNDKLNGLISLIAVEDKYTLKYPIFEKVHTLTLINFMKLTQIGYLRTDYSIHKGTYCSCFLSHLLTIVETWWQATNFIWYDTFCGVPSIQFHPSNLLLTSISIKTCFNFATCIVIAFFPSSNPLQLIQTNKHKWKSS